MFYTYCLQNTKSKELYYGYSDDLKRRMAEHRQIDKNWILIYYEAYGSKNDARKRENKLKHYGQSRTHLKNRITESLLK